MSGSEAQGLGLGVFTGVGAVFDIKHLVEILWAPLSRCSDLAQLWHVFWALDETTLLGMAAAAILLYFSLRALLFRPLKKLARSIKARRHRTEVEAAPAETELPPNSAADPT